MRRGQLSSVVCSASFVFALGVHDARAVGSKLDAAQQRDGGAARACTAVSERGVGEIVGRVEVPNRGSLPGRAVTVQVGETLCLAADASRDTFADLVVVNEATRAAPALRIDFAQIVHPNGILSSRVRVENPFSQPVRFSIAVPYPTRGDASFALAGLILVEAGGFVALDLTADTQSIALLGFRFADETRAAPLATDVESPPAKTVEPGDAKESPRWNVAFGFAYEWHINPLPALLTELQNNGYSGLSNHRQSFGVIAGFWDFRWRFELTAVFSQRTTSTGQARVSQYSANALVGYDFYRSARLRTFAATGLSADGVSVGSSPETPALFPDAAAGCCVGQEEVVFERNPWALPLVIGADYQLWTAETETFGLAAGARAGYRFQLSDGEWRLRDTGATVEGGPAISIGGPIAQLHLTLVGVF